MFSPGEVRNNRERPEAKPKLVITSGRFPHRCGRRVWRACWRVVLEASASIPLCSRGLQITAGRLGVQAETAPIRLTRQWIEAACSKTSYPLKRSHLLHQAGQIGSYSSRRPPQVQGAWCRGIRTPPLRALIGRSLCGPAARI